MRTQQEGGHLHAREERTQTVALLALDLLGLPASRAARRQTSVLYTTLPVASCYGHWSRWTLLGKMSAVLAKQVQASARL